MSSTALAAASLAIASETQRDAKDAKCAALVSGYEHGTATVEQQKEYADCIDFMYPNQLTGGEVLFLKAVILCALAGAALLSWWGWEDADLLEIVRLFITGAIIGAFVPPLCFAIITAIKFLFTA